MVPGRKGGGEEGEDGRTGGWEDRRRGGREDGRRGGGEEGRDAAFSTRGCWKEARRPTFGFSSAIVTAMFLGVTLHLRALILIYKMSLLCH